MDTFPLCLWKLLSDLKIFLSGQREKFRKGTSVSLHGTFSLQGRKMNKE